MSEARFLFAIAVFLGAVGYLSVAGAETGMETSGTDIKGNITQNDTGMMDNVNTIYDYMTETSAEYDILTYIIVVPITIVAIYIIAKLIIDIIPL